MLIRKNYPRSYAFVAVLKILLFSPVALAVEEKKSGYQGSAEVGIIHTSGNVHTQFNYWRGYVVNDRKIWRLYANLGGSSTLVNDKRISERYDAFMQSDYKLFDLDYLYLNLEYESDKFSGYSHRGTEILGYGHSFPKLGAFETKTELGLGLRHTFFVHDGRVTNEPVVNLKGTAIYRFTEETYLEQIASAKIGEDTSIYMSETSLVQALLRNFALKTSYTAIYSTEVPVGVRNTDIVARIILVYNFEKK